MNFRTQIPIKPSAQQITLETGLMFIGSCFAENIGERLFSAQFPIEINPFGIQYNPLSVEQSLLRLIANKAYNETEIFEHEGRWHSFGHHSRFSAATKGECLKNINRQIAIASKKLREIDFLFITFGTAWAYCLAGTESVVSNCHKLPEKCFIRHRLPVEEIVERYTELLAGLLKINPKLQIVFTVSPIRHWKDTAHGNNLSKATLLLAIEQIIQQSSNASYFPAYEIMLDELRDYRFYADDMQHPNATAISYIWQRFSERYFSPETQKTVAETEKRNRRLAHRPLF